MPIRLGCGWPTRLATCGRARPRPTLPWPRPCRLRSPHSPVEYSLAPVPESTAKSTKKKWSNQRRKLRNETSCNHVTSTYFLYTYNDIPEAVLVVLEVTSLRWFLASLHKAVLLGFLRIFVWSPTHLPTVGPATSVTSNANCIRCLVPAIV